MARSDPARRTILLAISGDGEAFNRLVREHQAYIGALLRRGCGDWAMAEDLAQETFLQAWRQLAGLREPEAFHGWLRRIALNVLVDAARRGRIGRRQLDDPAPGEPPPAPEGRIAERIDLEDALARLGFTPRMCIVLAYGEGMSHGEIAGALDLPLGTVKSHIARGLSRLRARLGPGDETDD